MFRNIFKDILRPDKTPVSEFEMLMIINEQPGIKVGELSSIMSITRPNLTPLIDNLEENKLIERKQDKKDKRITRLFITNKGLSQMEQNFKLIEERIATLKDKYTEQELEEIKELCEKLKSKIK